MKEQVAPTYGDAAVLPARILPSFLGERSLVKALTNEDDLSMLDSPTGFMLTGSVGTGKTMLLDLFYNSLPVKKQRIHYHAFLLGLYRKVFVALEEQRVQLEGEEQEMQRLAGEDISQGYPWSRKEENKAKALTKGWRQVFASGRKFDDPKLVKEYVLARVALDLIKNATVMAFDEVQLVDIAGAVSCRRPCPSDLTDASHRALFVVFSLGTGDWEESSSLLVTDCPVIFISMVYSKINSR